MDLFVFTYIIKWAGWHYDHLKNTYEELGAMENSQLIIEKELNPLFIQCFVF